MTLASSSSSSSRNGNTPCGPFGPTFQIIPGVQSYDWGKLAGRGSAVAKYAGATKQLNFQKRDDKPYAELWMGTHPTLPSRIIPTAATSSSSSSSTADGDYITLSSYLADHPVLVGKSVQQRFFPGGEGEGGSSSTTSSNGDTKGSGSAKADIPFLFKVLSIGKALSIQAHPDKTLGKKLHAEKPDMYKDDNHKPEMAIALTAFRGFCGFRPIKEIAKYLLAVPEFHDVVQPGKELIASLTELAKEASSSIEEKEKKSLLRQVFALLMEADSKRVEKCVQTISQRYEEHLNKSGGGGGKEALEVEDKLAELVCTLNKQYPGDVGVFCSFVLNVMELEKGESMFLMANEPHAYLEGDIIECMAASDNVVRAGLTPKARDVQVLIDMLTYSDEASDKKLMKAKAFLPDASSENKKAYEKYASSSTKDDNNIASPSDVPSLLYDPPIDEFSVLMTQMSEGDASETQRALQGPSMLIVTSGSGTLASHPGSSLQAEEKEFQLSAPGQVFFVGAETKITLKAGKGGLVVFRAFVEV